MSTQQEKQQIVTDGVEAFAKAENGLDQALEGLTMLRKIYQRAGSAQMLPGGEAVKTMNQLSKIYGEISRIEESIYDLHKKAIVVAQANDADIGNAGFVVMGGSPR